MAGMTHFHIVPTVALVLIAEAKILISQLFVLVAKPLHFLKLSRSPAAAKSWSVKIHKQARDKNAHHQSSGER